MYIQIINWEYVLSEAMAPDSLTSDWSEFD
jgi:hypothetical protein